MSTVDPSALNSDAIDACISLVDRTGASGFEIGYLYDDVPVAEANWYAMAMFRGARIMADGHQSPSLAAMALSERLLHGATCRCGKPVALSTGAGCRWRLLGNRWEPGCNAPSIEMGAGTRGDHNAMTQALHEQAGNRAQRRASKKKRRK